MSRPTAEEFHQLSRHINQIPELAGAGIGWVGDGASYVARPSNHRTKLTTFVVLTEDQVERRLAQTAAERPPPNLRIELIGLGLNCAGAVISGLTLLPEAGAAPVTGGASIALAWVTWGAFLATGAQCANSLMRTTSVIRGYDWTDQLDEETWYVWAEAALDALSVLGVGVSVTATVRTVLALRAATSKGFGAILKGLSRAERKRLTTELIRMQKPNISNSAMKELIRAGEFPTRFSATAIRAGLLRQLKDAIAATISFTSSAVGGNVRLLYVTIYQE